MGNYNNNLDLIHFNLSIASDKSKQEGLLQIFDYDLDFTENEQYFRKDTLKKGYENEAHRIVAEYMEKTPIDNLDQLVTAVTYFASKIFANTNYYDGYTVSVRQFDNKNFSVAVAYTG